MSSVINTNVPSLNAQRNLAKSQDALQTSLQRLSSGLRINSAKDDAAGLGIASRMSAQINGLNQAARNANDGISLAQTAEGALSSVGDSLQRIRELSVQSANASNSTTDRASIQAEVNQLVAQIDTVANQTAYNGVKVLDGTFTQQSFQVGANSGDTITIASIASAKAADLGVGSASSYSATVTSGAVGATALVAGGLAINGFSIGGATSDGVSSTTPTASAIAVARAINDQSSLTGVTASVNATTQVGAAATTFLAIAAGDVKINGVDIGAIGTAANAVERGNQVAAAVNAKQSQTGVNATYNTTTGVVTLGAADGRNIDISGTGTAANTGLTAATTRSTVTLNSTGQSGISVTGITAAGLTAAGLTAGVTAAVGTAGSGVSKIDVSTAAGASAALATIDAALNSVNASRGQLGAVQNRFMNVVSNLSTTSENLSAARSRIQDADFASETANLTKAQILQQAGTAMLSQANSLPQSVLSLLK